MSRPSTDRLSLSEKLVRARTEAEAVEERVRARVTARRAAIVLPPPETVPFERSAQPTEPPSEAPTRRLRPASVDEQAIKRGDTDDAPISETRYSIVFGRSKPR